MGTRREFLAGAAGLAAVPFIPEKSAIIGSLPAAETELGKVKIKDVRTAVINLGRYPMVLVKVKSDREVVAQD